MARLSNEAARELFSKAKPGKKIVVDPGVLENIIARDSNGGLPAPKVLVPKGENIAQEGPKKGKYGNIKVPDPEDPKRPFDSKLEARHGKDYRLKAKIGEIISVTRQPKFFLQGGVVYIADFLILHLDYSVEIVDSKGVITPDFRNKEKLFRAMHPHLKFTVRSK